MTQDRRAPVSHPVQPQPAVRRRGPSLATGLLIGGGLLGCVAAGFAFTAPQASQTVLASSLPQPARHIVSARIVSAPDLRRFGENEASAAPAEMLDAVAHRENRVGHARPVFSHLDQKRAAAAHPKAVAAKSHRFAPVTSSQWATFLPATPPVLVAAQAQEVAVDHRIIATSLTSKPNAPAQPEVTLASLEPEHVEVALPDLPVEALPPQNARDALERELAQAVPMPTARPFRQAAIAEPDLRKRSRAPAGLLAYARPDAGSLGDEEPAFAPKRIVPSSPSLGAGTAVYDISASTVYLPNGEKLEAHSGLGSLRDDVRYVHVKNRGATPPHTYNLTMRESLFHGVAAIRLTPIGGERKIHNRNGLLAHTYMLGPRGDSNGCVSFKDYKRFLAAFKRGEIKRLVVVPSYKNPTSRIASMFGMGKR